MYAYLYSKDEEENKKTGMMTSFAIHMLLLLLLLCIPLAPIKKITEDFQGIVVDFGVQEAGITIEEIDQPATEASAATAEAEVEPSTEPIEKTESQAQESKAQPTKVKVLAVSESKLVEEESPIVVKKEVKIISEPVVDNSKELERLKKEKTERETAEKQRQAEAQRAQKEKAEAEAKAQALEENKSKFGSLFGQGSTGTEEAKKGDELGKPDASALDAMSSGKGTTGDGLNSRGIVFEPEIKDNSQKTGKVVVEVCVNSQGKVTSAKYTQKGSTTTDQYLADLGVKNARKYVFTASSIDEQCGSITINFVLN